MNRDEKNEKRRLYYSLNKEKIKTKSDISGSWHIETQKLMPYTCPVCSGNGLVPNGFYAQTSRDWMTTSTVPETCKSCNGSGIIWG
jgi:DnaJ-class molecular chaperone